MASSNAYRILLVVISLQGVFIVQAKPAFCGGGCGEVGTGELNGGYGYGGGYGGCGGGCGPVVAPTPPISFLPYPQPVPIKVPAPAAPKQSVTIPNIILALLPPTTKPPSAPKPIIRPPPPPIVLPIPQPYPPTPCPCSGQFPPPCGC